MIDKRSMEDIDCQTPVERSNPWEVGYHFIIKISHKHSAQDVQSIKGRFFSSSDIESRLRGSNDLVYTFNPQYKDLKFRLLSHQNVKSAPK